VGNKGEIHEDLGRCGGFGGGFGEKERIEEKRGVGLQQMCSHT